MVRLAKAHTDLALPVCIIPLDQICLVSCGDASGGNTRAERAQAGHVILFADRALLEGMAAPVTLVAMGLSEAITQGDWVHALWSRVVLGLNLREWREQENVPHFISVTDSKGTCDHLHNETVGPSEDRRKRCCSSGNHPKRPVQTADVLAVGCWEGASGRRLDQGDGDLLRAMCRQAFTVPAEAPKILAARRQEKRERERVPRVKSPSKLREPVDETLMSVTTTTTVT